VLLCRLEAVSSRVSACNILGNSYDCFFAKWLINKKRESLNNVSISLVVCQHQAVWPLGGYIFRKLLIDLIFPHNVCYFNGLVLMSDRA